MSVNAAQKPKGQRGGPRGKGKRRVYICHTCRLPKKAECKCPRKSARPSSSSPKTAGGRRLPGTTKVYCCSKCGLPKKTQCTCARKVKRKPRPQLQQQQQQQQQQYQPPLQRPRHSMASTSSALFSAHLRAAAASPESGASSILASMCLPPPSPQHYPQLPRVPHHHHQQHALAPLEQLPDTYMPTAPPLHSTAALRSSGAGYQWVPSWSPNTHSRASSHPPSSNGNTVLVTLRTPPEDMLLPGMVKKAPASPARTPLAPSACLHISQDDVVANAGAPVYRCSWNPAGDTLAVVTCVDLPSLPSQAALFNSSGVRCRLQLWNVGLQTAAKTSSAASSPCPSPSSSSPSSPSSHATAPDGSTHDLSHHSESGFKLVLHHAYVASPDMALVHDMHWAPNSQTTAGIFDQQRHHGAPPPRSGVLGLCLSNGSLAVFPAPPALADAPASPLEWDATNPDSCVVIPAWNQLSFRCLRFHPSRPVLLAGSVTGHIIGWSLSGCGQGGASVATPTVLFSAMSPSFDPWVGLRWSPHNPDVFASFTSGDGVYFWNQRQPDKPILHNKSLGWVNDADWTAHGGSGEQDRDVAHGLAHTSLSLMVIQLPDLSSVALNGELKPEFLSLSCDPDGGWVAGGSTAGGVLLSSLRAKSSRGKACPVASQLDVCLSNGSLCATLNSQMYSRPSNPSVKPKESRLAALLSDEGDLPLPAPEQAVHSVSFNPAIRRVVVSGMACGLLRLQYVPAEL